MFFSKPIVTRIVLKFLLERTCFCFLMYFKYLKLNFTIDFYNPYVISLNLFKIIIIKPMIVSVSLIFLQKFQFSTIGILPYMHSE